MAQEKRLQPHHKHALLGSFFLLFSKENYKSMHSGYIHGRKKNHTGFMGIVGLSDSESSQILRDENTVGNQLLDGANK